MKSKSNSLTLRAAASAAEVDPVVDLLGRLRLDRQARDKGVLIVEGPSDRRALARMLGIDERRIFQVAGRNNVLRCATELEDCRLCGVVCLADRDFDEHEDNWAASSLVFFDNADLESMFIGSPALGRFLEEWASDEKLSAAGGATAVRKLIIERLRPLSAARAENARQGLGLPFDKLEVRALFSKEGEFKASNFRSTMAQRTSTSDSALAAMLVADAPACPHTGEVLCRGHDAMALIGVLLRKTLGSLSHQQTGREFIERSIRLALSPGDFSGTPFESRLETALRAVAC